MTMQWWHLTLAGVAVLLLGMLLGAAVVRGRAAVRLAGAEAERDGLARELAAVREDAREDREAAAQLAPLRAALERVETQVRTLERDRVEQFGQVGEHLAQVAATTRTLQEQTAGLAGALNSSTTRGTWGEVQLRRVLEHAGMLERCDFDEQVGAVSRHDIRVRPDVVVRLPGEKFLVLDSKAPLTAFLRAQADGLAPEEVARLLRQHADSLRGHVDALAGKEYWSAFPTSPELVVCFVPGDAVLAAALRAAPDLYDHAQSRRVVLASPAVLLALLRATALAWQQDTLTDNARELLRLGTDLHQRLATLGRHVTGMGTALRRSVEAYNQLVGTLESRVLVTSRRMHDLGLVETPVPAPPSLEVAPRPLTSTELLSGELESVAPPRRELGDVAPPRRRDVHGDETDEAVS
ncbi:DNA recombination protein RmuC [Ornithinimicrobium humiphilum]|uniref:DNA recombination protein RmuC n=1 Tax=Ornithinimicrobium humiphilum TaxID=125288 RepID=A0A543KR49_9MICO|nr:DNA recombination protein RmuC [Ornithinimicrobium humiphilum]TQM97548.1 DNA recombination protein RmuC [Ornithinimicrobium humiphilum]